MDSRFEPLDAWGVAFQGEDRTGGELGQMERLSADVAAQVQDGRGWRRPGATRELSRHRPDCLVPAAPKAS
jgi:hypothetical protein